MISFRNFWFLSLAIKLGLGAVIPLSNDEAYYWIWGHHLQWSYFDHPPAVAWLFWLGQPFEFLKDLGMGGAVRWPAVILGHSALLLVKKLLSPSLSERQHLQWLSLVLLSPFFGVGSLVITPDVPLVFFWVAALLMFKTYLSDNSVQNAALLGTILGLGFCSKYHMVLFVPIALLYIFVKKDWRALSITPFATTLIFGLITSAPVWGWNLANEWVSFRFQLDHGLEQKANGYAQIIDYVGAQAALLSPLVLFSVGFVKKAKVPSAAILLWFGWGPILFFLWTSTRSPVEANWPIAGHLSLLVFAALADAKRWASRAMMCIWAIASILVLSQALSPDTSFFGIPASRLKTYEFIKFRELEDFVKLQSTEGTEFFASSYQMAGALSFASGKTVSKLAGLNRKDFFDFGEIGHPKNSIFRVALEEEWPWPSWIVERGFKLTSTASVGRFKIYTFEKSP